MDLIRAVRQELERRGYRRVPGAGADWFRSSTWATTWRAWRLEMDAQGGVGLTTIRTSMVRLPPNHYWSAATLAQPGFDLVAAIVRVVGSPRRRCV